MIAQLTRLCNFLGAPPTPIQQSPLVRLDAPGQMDMGVIQDETVHQGQVLVPPRNLIIDPPRALVH